MDLKIYLKFLPHFVPPKGYLRDTGYALREHSGSPEISYPPRLAITIKHFDTVLTLRYPVHWIPLLPAWPSCLPNTQIDFFFVD
jgi:hypothetical protein